MSPIVTLIFRLLILFTFLMPRPGLAQEHKLLLTKLTDRIYVREDFFYFRDKLVFNSWTEVD